MKRRQFTGLDTGDLLLPMKSGELETPLDQSAQSVQHSPPPSASSHHVLFTRTFEPALSPAPSPPPPVQSLSLRLTILMLRTKVRNAHPFSTHRCAFS